MSTSDPLQSLVAGPGYAEQLRDRELRERSAMFGLGGVGLAGYPAPAPPPTSSPALFPPGLAGLGSARPPAVSPATPAATPPLSRHTPAPPPVSKVGVAPGLFSPQSPFLPPGHTNNSSLSEKLKLGFGEARERSPAATPTAPPPHTPPESTIKREGPGLGLGFLRPAGPLSLAQASPPSSLVTSASHSGRQRHVNVCRLTPACEMRGGWLLVSAASVARRVTDHLHTVETPGSLS